MKFALEHIIDRLIELAPANAITGADMESWRQKALDELQRKYPSAGLSRAR